MQTDVFKFLTIFYLSFSTNTCVVMTCDDVCGRKLKAYLLVILYLILRCLLYICNKTSSCRYTSGQCAVAKPLSSNGILHCTMRYTYMDILPQIRYTRFLYVSFLVVVFWPMGLHQEIVAQPLTTIKETVQRSIYV